MVVVVEMRVLPPSLVARDRRQEFDATHRQTGRQAHGYIHEDSLNAHQETSLPSVVGLFWSSFLVAVESLLTARHRGASG